MDRDTDTEGSNDRRPVSPATSPGLPATTPASDRGAPARVTPNESHVTAAHAVVPRQRPPWGIAIRYLFPLVATGLAFLLSVLFEGYLAREIFVLFWPAVLATAVWAGLGPALVASVLSVVLVDYWFIPPRGFVPARPTDLIAVAIFFLASALVSSLTEQRRRAEANAADAARANAELAKRIEEQTVEVESQLEESQAIAEQLEHTTVELQERSKEAESATLFANGILESIGDPFVVQDAEWHFRYINDAAAKILSAQGNREQLLGRVLWEVYPELVGTAFEREMRRSASERIPIHFEAFNAERGNWAELSCYPLHDGGLATQWKNITARKKAEEARHYLDRTTELFASPLDPEERLTDLARLVVPQLADWCGIDILDENGAIKQVAVAHVDPDKVHWASELNRRYPPRPDAPTGVPNVLRTGKAELFPEITDEMLVATAVDDEHLRIVREIGLRSAMLVPLSARDHTFGVLTLVTAESRRRYGADDLALATELARRAALAIDGARQHQQAIRAQQDAEAANQAKSQFLAAMSHELRTPLNAIGGYAQLLAMGVRGPLSDVQQVDLARIEQSQRHLLRLINDVLDFARIEAGRVEYRLAPVSVADLLSELEDFMRPQLRDRTLEFHCDHPDDGVLVLADRDKVRQILLNLLSNAVKFTPERGRIDVTCDQLDGRVRIHVRDNGVGIAPDRLESVFEPFVQAHRSLTEPTGGVGLGLTISRDLAHAMKGDLHVESRVGEGSTFTLDLPATTDR